MAPMVRQRRSKSTRSRPAKTPPHSVRVDAAKARVAAQLPDIDPGDLDLIISSLLKPFGTGRRFFLRQIRPGVYVF